MKFFESVGKMVSNTGGAVGHVVSQASQVVTETALSTGEVISSATSQAFVGTAMGLGQAFGGIGEVTSTINFTVLLESLESLIDSIITNDPECVINYVKNIRVKNPQLSNKEIAQKIVNDQSLINGLLGAGTGALGLIALPATIPADLAKAWRIQAFTIQCIAYSYKYTDHNTDLKTDVYLLLSNDSMESIKQMATQELASAARNAVATTEAIKKSVTRQVAKAAPQYAAKAIVKCAGKQAANYAMKGIPKHLAKALWKIGGRKIVERAIQKSLTKAVPVIGAVTGFAFDWTSTKAVGNLAIEFYENSMPEFIDRAFNS
jgi:hypothetical protein